MLLHTSKGGVPLGVLKHRPLGGVWGVPQEENASESTAERPFFWHFLVGTPPDPV